MQIVRSTFKTVLSFEDHWLSCCIEMLERVSVGRLLFIFQLRESLGCHISYSLRGDPTGGSVLDCLWVEKLPKTLPLVLINPVLSWWNLSVNASLPFIKHLLFLFKLNFFI